MKAKLAALALATAIAGVSAHAQTEQLIPPASDAPVVNMERYCRWRGDTARFYPQRAMEQGVAGRVVLDCTLREDGSMRACQVVEEEPVGWDFGEASLRLACRHRAALDTPTTPTSQIYERDGEYRQRRVLTWQMRQ